jgi:hypothetical protein
MVGSILNALNNPSFKSLIAIGEFLYAFVGGVGHG